MSGVIAVSIQILAAVGYGAVAMRALGVLNDMAVGLRISLSFALGLGIIGWLVLPLSVVAGLNDATLGALLGLGILGIVSLLPIKMMAAKESWSTIQLLLGGALLVVLVFDLIEAMAPPSDADSLAYHFALPKLFIELGQVAFIPRAVDGATPMLVQMTYVPVLNFGDERGLNLWALLSGWAAVALVFFLSRIHMTRTWSLVTALLFASAPAIIYGAGSGQVETRLALFVMVCAWSMAQFFKTERFAYVVLAGVAAGFFGGAKLTGLMFMAGVVLVMLPRPSWFKIGVGFSVVSALAAAPWYLWTFVHIGDPFFPMLYPILGVSNPLYWDDTHQEVFNWAFRSGETPVPINPATLLAFPIIGTLFPYPTMEAGRTGLGPAIVLLLPSALALIWVGIQARRINAIGIYGLIAFVFFAIWFLTGTPQRVRHLIPVLPLILLGLVYGAAWASETWRNTGVIAGSLAIVVMLQLGGAALFGKQFFAVASGQMTRDAFLHKSVSLYDPVPWLNKNLKPTDKIMTPIRQHLYYLDVPYFFVHAFMQAEVDISPEFSNEDLIPSLHRLGITHVLAYRQPIDGAWNFGPGYQVLIEAGCLTGLHSGSSNVIQSRTLGGAKAKQPFTVFKFDRLACPKT